MSEVFLTIFIFRPSHNIAQAHFDEYEHYNFDQDKTIFTGHGGKSRLEGDAVTDEADIKGNSGVRKSLSRTPTDPTLGATRGRFSPN